MYKGSKEFSYTFIQMCKQAKPYLDQYWEPEIEDVVYIDGQLLEIKQINDDGSFILTNDTKATKDVVVWIPQTLQLVDLNYQWVDQYGIILSDFNNVISVLKTLFTKFVKMASYFSSINDKLSYEKLLVVFLYMQENLIFDFKEFKWKKVENKEPVFTLDELQCLILKWAEDRDILSQGTVLGQALKTNEEVVELLKAINKNDKEQIKDALGDIFVTIVLVAALAKLDLTECVNYAYNQIKNRKGKMVNGIFVKEEDLIKQKQENQKLQDKQEKCSKIIDENNLEEEALHYFK